VRASDYGDRLGLPIPAELGKPFTMTTYVIRGGYLPDVRKVVKLVELGKPFTLVVEDNRAV
jgi:hypothetical protein